MGLDADPATARHNAADTCMLATPVTGDIDVRRHTAYTPGGCRGVGCRSAAINPKAIAAAPISRFVEWQRLRVAHARDAATDGSARPCMAEPALFGLLSPPKQSSRADCARELSSRPPARTERPTDGADARRADRRRLANLGRN